MSSLQDIAFFLYNCDKSTLLLLSGPSGCGKTFLREAMQLCLEDIIEAHEEGDYDPSPSFEGACRILTTSEKSPVVDSTYPWVRNIGFITVDRNVIGSFPTSRRLAAVLRAEIDKVTDED